MLKLIDFLSNKTVKNCLFCLREPPVLKISPDNSCIIKRYNGWVHMKRIVPLLVTKV